MRTPEPPQHPGNLPEVTCDTALTVVRVLSGQPCSVVGRARHRYKATAPTVGQVRHPDQIRSRRTGASHTVGVMSTESTNGTAPLRDRLRAALPAAMKARDRRAAAALRSALAAIDNAESVDIVDLKAGAIESSAVGLGAAEVARRHLTESDIERIVRAEIDERHAAAAQYERVGHADRATDLLAEADALATHVD